MWINICISSDVNIFVRTGGNWKRICVPEQFSNQHALHSHMLQSQLTVTTSQSLHTLIS